MTFLQLPSALLSHYITLQDHVDTRTHGQKYKGNKTSEVEKEQSPGRVLEIEVRLRD
jgi:hypothetical protein